jgi:Mrp family chromosome partitioning ATPase
MRGLMERLKSEADLLILDSPPSLAVTDAAVLASLVDGVLLVVEHGSSRRDVVMRAVKGFKQVRANLLGAVLNKVPVRRGDRYGRYYEYGGTGDEKGTGHARRRTGMTAIIGKVLRR